MFSSLNACLKLPILSKGYALARWLMILMSIYATLLLSSSVVERLLSCAGNPIKAFKAIILI